MPVYEFLCTECNIIFKFFSRTINTEKCPFCPQCNRDTLQRQISLFATVDSKKEDSDPLDNLPVDEAKLEQAVHKLMGESEKINEDDPRQAADLMQKFSDMTGLKYNNTIQEALERMGAGENPEDIEAQLGENLDEEIPFIVPGKKGKQNRKPPPRHDPNLYEM